MKQNPNTMEFDAETDQTPYEACNACGEEYENPLLAELLSGEDAKEYYACPRCLSKVREIKGREKIEFNNYETEVEAEEEVEILEFHQENEPAKTENPSDCPYELGYLKKRPKNSSIPDGCFTCSKMIDCTI